LRRRENKIKKNKKPITTKLQILRNNKSKDCCKILQSQTWNLRRRENKIKKNKKPITTKLERITPCVPSRAIVSAVMIHKISKDIFYHSKPPHVPLKHGGAAYSLTNLTHMPIIFFVFIKGPNCPSYQMSIMKKPLWNYE
jgi:hypothetical protein